MNWDWLTPLIGALPGAAAGWLAAQRAKRDQPRVDADSAVDRFDALTARLDAEIERLERARATDRLRYETEIAELRAGLAACEAKHTAAELELRQIRTEVSRDRRND